MFEFQQHHIIITSSQKILIEKMVLPISYLLLALPFFLILVIVQRYKRSSVGKRRAPPGPPGLPFIGNLHQIDATNSHEYFWKLSKKYGPLMSMKLGSKPLLVISSAKIAEEALKKQDLLFSGRPLFYSIKKISYNGSTLIFSPYNEYWREMRKVSVLHLFSAKQVQSFRPIREDEVQRLIQQIYRYASTREVFDLSEMIMSLSYTLIFRVAFGKTYDEQSQKRRFDQLLHDVPIIFKGFFFSNFLPSLSWIDHLTGLSAKLERIFKELDSFSQELIDEHLRPNRHESMKEDILSILLRLQKDKSTPVDLTLDNVKALLLDIFFAGADTSAVTIIWTMTALIKNPRIMRKVQTEIRDAVKEVGLVTEDDIQNLQYFKAIIKETLRLYPPAPLLVPRETTKQCTIDGYEVQPNSLVYLNAFAIARDPQYWENPNEFLPERFLNNKVDYKGQHFEFIPFGAGRRICPGMSMGIASLELALANILYSFNWELPPGMKEDDVDNDISQGIVMQKKNPLCLIATKPQC